jgi:hypothetical protein
MGGSFIAGALRSAQGQAFRKHRAADGGDKQEDRGISKQVKVSKGEVKTENEKNLNDMEAKKAEAQVQLDKLSKATTNE